MHASASQKKQINHACYVKQLVTCGKTADPYVELCDFSFYFIQHLPQKAYILFPGLKNAGKYPD